MSIGRAQLEDKALSAMLAAFKGITPEQARILITNGRFSECPVDTILTKEGEYEYVFYILLDGEVVVTKKLTDDEDRLLNTLKGGAFFGEMSIIDDAPRAATIRTTKTSTVLAIDREAFMQALHQSPSMSIGMIREVSSRLRANDELAISDLRIKNKELGEAYKALAELEQVRREFLTTIAHGLRTPLTSAAGFMQIIRMGMMEGEALKGGLETVSSNLDKIVALTNDILFLQEMDLILDEFTQIDLNEMLRGIITKEADHLKEMNIKAKIDLPASLPKIAGDASSLERAFGAIINNAIKFSINGKDIEISAIQDNQDIVIYIRDYGLGIREVDYENIFNRFWRTEEHDGQLFSGVGLGLPIAKQVFEQHGGSIQVLSEWLSWTKFTIRLKIDVEETK